MFLVTLACFAVTWNFGYLTWDDTINFTENTHLNRPGGPDFGYYWLHSYTRAYRPLISDIWSLIAVFCRVHPHIDPAVGLVNFSPHGFHTVTLAVHAVDAVLLFVVLRMLFRRSAPAAAGALLFAIHPLQDETVAWITGGNVVYFGLFLFLMLIHYIRYAAPEEQAPTNANIQYGLAAFWYLCAAFTYPLTVIVPIVVWIIDWVILGRPINKASMALGPWLIFGVIWTFVTATAKNLDKAVVHVAPGGKPLVALDSIAFYLYKFIAPVNLTIDYGRTPDYVTGHSWSFATAGIAALFIGLLWQIRKRWPVLTAAGAIFVVGILPTSGIVTNPFQLYSTVADRYTYLSLFGPAIALTWGLAVLPVHQLRPALAAAFAMLALLGGMTVHQILRFRNDDTLFTYTLRVNPASWGMALNYGVYLHESKRYDEAQRTLEHCLAIMPNFPQANSELGDLLATKGDHAGAAERIQHAIDYTTPPDYKLFVQLGQQLIDLDRFDQAAGAFQQAITLNPNDEEAEQGLGIALGNTGDRAGGIDHLRKASRMNPKDTRALDNLGIFLAESGQVPAAIQAWTAALSADPNYTLAHFNLATALEDEHRKPEALAQYQAVLRLDPNNPRAQAAVIRLQGHR